MAEATQRKRHDTLPDIRGLITDSAGDPVDLTAADKLVFLAKIDGSNEYITGEAEALSEGENPYEEDGDGNKWNWRYVLAGDDLDIAGDYEVEIEVWDDEKAEPPLLRTYPPDKAKNPVLEVDADVNDAP